MATYYFYSTSSSDWYDSNNWWNDSAHTSAAGLVPSSSDDVVIQSSIGSTSQTMYANNATIEVPFWNFNYGLVVGETVTFTGSSRLGDYGGTPGVVTANNAILSADASPPVEIRTDGTLTVSANVDMYGSSINNGTINGNVRFYDSSSNGGSVVGNAVVYHPHPAPFYSATGNTGSISGTITYTNYPTRNLTFYGGSSADWGDINQWSENGSPVTYLALPVDNITGITNSTLIINTIPNFIPTINNFTTAVDVILDCPLIVNGTANVNNLTLSGSSYIGGSGTFNINNAGTVTFNDSSYNESTIYPNSFTPSIIFNDSSHNDGTIQSDGNNPWFSPSFNDSSYNSISGSIDATNNYNPLVFNGSAANSGTITGNVVFQSGSSNAGTITGDATVNYPINRNSWNTGSVSGSTTFQNYPEYFYFLANGGMPTFDWNDINHWYVDPPASYTTPSTETRAAYIPGPLDSVKAYMSISNNTNIDTASVNVFNGEYNAEIGIPLNCNCANFNGSSRYSGSNLTQNWVNSGCGIIFNESSSNTGTINGAGCYGEIVGPIVFNDISYNSGIINGCTPGVEFREGSSNTGTVNGILTRVYYPVSIPFGGTINTSIIYIGYIYYFYDAASDGNWNNNVNWFLDESHTISANSVPTETYPGTNVTLLSNVSNNSAGTPTAYNLSIGGTLAISIPIVINGLATFSGTSSLKNDGSTLAGEIVGDALFTEDSYLSGGMLGEHGGIVQGLTTFTLSSAEYMILNGGYTSVAGQFNGGIEFKYGKGVNGSSILGIV